MMLTVACSFTDVQIVDSLEWDIEKKTTKSGGKYPWVTICATLVAMRGRKEKEEKPDR